MAQPKDRKKQCSSEAEDQGKHEKQTQANNVQDRKTDQQNN